MSRTARLRHSLRKTAKWGGALLSTIIACAWLIGELTSIGRLQVGQHCLVLAGGTCCVMHSDPADARDGGFIHRMSSYTSTKYNKRLIEIMIMSDWDWISWRGNWYFHFPLWAPLAVAATICGMGWWADLLARRRARIGKCIACGYPLDGLPPDAPCPECGKPSAAP